MVHLYRTETSNAQESKLLNINTSKRKRVHIWPLTSKIAGLKGFSFSNLKEKHVFILFIQNFFI